MPSFLTPIVLAAMAGLAVPVFVHLIQRERKTIIEFPSLMFIRRIPYESVERRRIHNWLLLLLRLAAMALIVAAFARPFFKEDPVKAAAASTGARDVVILLDHSASMGYGTHWARAQAEAKKIVDSLSGEDRASLVLFGSGVEENVRATPDRARLVAGIEAATVSSDGTRYAPALRLAQSLLSRSDRPRREAYLISDFQKTGWERQEEIHLPDGATIAPVSVAETETSNLTVSSVAIQRATFAGEERATITAQLVNRSGAAVTNQPVRLEIDGRAVGTRDISIEPNGSGTVTYDALTVSEANMRAAIHAGTDAMPKDNDFYFVLSPSRAISVLVIQADGADRASSLYFTTALDTGKAPPFKWDVVPASRVTAANLDKRAVVVLNDASTLGSATVDLLRQFVNQGGGLFVALGGHTPVNGDTPLMPSAPGSPVDRMDTRGATLGFLDYSHPIFEQFKDPRNGTFANMRFLRYRGLHLGPEDRVIARFDDGATAMAERKVGSGRVIVFASTLDDDWNSAPRSAMFVPLMHETVRYLAQYEDPQAYYPVGRVFDVASAVGAIVREGQASATVGAASGAGVAVSPSGAETRLGAGGSPSFGLAEQGFYSVRLSGMGERRPYAVAADLDPAESDLSPLQPAEFLKAATGRPSAVGVGQSLEQPEQTPADMEKKQSLWWFLLAAGLAALVAEGLLSDRRSRGRLAPVIVKQS